MTGQELDERINEQMDRERVKDKILALEIKQMRKALEKAVGTVEGQHNTDASYERQS